MNIKIYRSRTRLKPKIDSLAICRSNKTRLFKRFIKKKSADKIGKNNKLRPFVVTY